MSNKWDYSPEEKTIIGAGDYRLEIVAVEEKQSKSGNDMIVVTVQPNRSTIKINHYIVKNQYFNRNATELFDSFGIARGDFNLLSWVGTVGAGRLVEDENGYLKVRYFLDQKRAAALPAWEGAMPERQTVSTIGGFETVEDDNELPF